MNVLRLCSSLPSSYQRRPISPPPRTCAIAKTTPRSSSDSRGIENHGSIAGLVGAVAVEDAAAPCRRAACPCRHTIEIGTRVPSSASRPLAVLLVVAPGSKPARAPASACAASARPVAQVSRRPSRASPATCSRAARRSRSRGCRRARRCRSAPGTRCRTRRRRSAQHPQAGEPVAAQRHHEVPAKASTPSRRTPGSCAISADHCASGASTGATASSKFSAPSLCRISSRSPSVLDAVLDALAARRDQARRAGRVVGRDEPDLAGDLAAGVDDQEPLAAGQLDADPEPLVGLLVDQRRRSRGGAEHVPPHPVRAPGVVDGGVEQRATVGRPGRAVEHARDLVGQQPRRWRRSLIRSVKRSSPVKSVEYASSVPSGLTSNVPSAKKSCPSASSLPSSRICSPGSGAVAGLGGVDLARVRPGAGTGSPYCLPSSCGV